jgi:hypothetical protein
MHRYDDGQTSVRKLAERAVDEELAVRRGGRDAMVQRLSRKYMKLVRGLPPAAALIFSQTLPHFSYKYLTQTSAPNRST